MKNSNIEEIRKIFIETLEKYKGEPILFDIPSEILREMVTPIYTHSIRYIPKDIRPHLKKIDFANISFDNVVYVLELPPMYVEAILVNSLYPAIKDCNANSCCPY